MNVVFLFHHPKTTKNPTKTIEPIIDNTVAHGNPFGNTGPRK